MRRPPLPALAAALALAAAAPASAAPPDPADLVVDASPVIGNGRSAAAGWNEVVVLVENKGGQPARGRVEIATLGRRMSLTTAPFSVGAGAAVRVRLPTRMGALGDTLVEAFDEREHLVAQKTFETFVSLGVSILDVSEASRLRGALDEAPVAPLSRTKMGFRISIASPSYDPATGDPFLPDRAASYATIDAVLMRSDVLTRLAGAELDALASFVLAGGTLAVAVARPEDIRHPTITAFAGGAIVPQGAWAATLADFALPPPPSGLRAPDKTIAPARDPSGEVAEALVGYAGGNLHGSLYGSSAAYGLGEVHLLAFDPTQRPAVDDPWVQARVIDLARRAFDRRSTQVFRPGADLSTSAYYGSVRRELDPNESSRWAIAAATLLLIVYAILAGPVSFSLAARAGRPLRALVWLPLFAAAAFALVVGIGVVAKGPGGRARHLTLIEAGAGMGKGSARRFRGFYASRASDLTVHGSDAGSVLSTAVAEVAEWRDHLLVDKAGLRLVEVTALPWQTVVVREDGFASIGDGIALIDDGGDLAVVNRSGHDLRAAVVRSPRGDAYYFPRIKDGDRVTTTVGTKLGAHLDGRKWEAAMQTPRHDGVDLHPIAAPLLRPVVEPDAPGLADAWQALGEAAGDGAVDWFPDGVPVLVGQLDGGEGTRSDAGLRLDSDRILVRVVGFGGRP
jgi:hypothetical protein